MQCDYAGLSLPDSQDKERLRLYVLDFPEGKGFLREEMSYSIERSPSGETFRTMKPLTIRSPFTGWVNDPVAPIVQIAVREGLKAFCFLPLVRQNRAIGVLVLGRLRDDAFTEDDIHFLGQIANQKMDIVLGEGVIARSEEHTSELQSLRHLVCRLLLE